MSVNVVHLVGRAGKDPETKYFESGKVLCTFTLAVNRRSKNSDQPLIGIKGSLKMDTWNDKNTGLARSKPVILVDQLDLLGSKRDSEANSEREF